MLFNPPGGDVLENVWSPLIDGEALPAWLTLTGGTMTVQGSDGDRGFARFTTGAVSGNLAGFKTAATINASSFSEVGMFVSGWVTDITDGTKMQYVMQWSDGIGGTSAFTSQVDGLVNHRNYPAAAEFPSWQLMNQSNGQRRKSFGILVRPQQLKSYMTAGDPVLERAGSLWYNAAWVNNSTPQQFICQVVTRENVAHYMDVSKVVLRLRKR